MNIPYTYDNVNPSSIPPPFFRLSDMAFLSPSPLGLPRSSATPCSICAFNVWHHRKRRRRTSYISASATPLPPLSPEPAANAGDEPQSPDSPTSIFSKLADTVAEFFYAPLASCSVISRQWECVAGNYILGPSGEPKAVIHFIGGAFIGATPQIMYRSFLEQLVQRGYVVVATPYNLSFDYMDSVAGIADSWTMLRNNYLSKFYPSAEIPVIGVGHSAGALFQSLGSSLFLDDFNRRTANVLISFNNMQASDAIPVYKNVFAPAFSSIVQLENTVPQELREGFALIPNAFEDFIMGNGLTPNRVRENFLPTLQEARMILEQIAPLIREIGTDTAAPEFYPTPDDCKAAIENLYDIPNTLIVRFENDGIDASEKLEEMIREKAKQTAPENDMNITTVKLSGTHITPLAQNIPNATGNAVGKALQGLADGAGASDMTKLVEVLDGWIEQLP